MSIARVGLETSLEAVLQLLIKSQRRAPIVPSKEVLATILYYFLAVTTTLACREDS